MLKLGRYTRFVSHSVMTGFLTGVSLILILSQFGDLVGYPATGANSVAKAWDTLTHIPEWSMPALAIGASAMVIAVALDRTPLSTIGPLLAIVVPSVVVAMRPQAEVALASDTAEIPAGMPMPALPSFDLVSPTIAVTSALAITVVILVQSSGVAGQFRNPDGAPSNISRDFVAHGAANLATSLFRGIPSGVGGPDRFQRPGRGRRPVVGDRLRGVDDHLPGGPLGLVGQVAMPTLAALLILAGVQS